MKFDNLQEAIKIAKLKNMNIQKQDNHWITVAKDVIPLAKRLNDIEVAIEKTDDENLKVKLKSDWKKLKNEVKECL